MVNIAADNIFPIIEGYCGGSTTNYFLVDDYTTVFDYKFPTPKVSQCFSIDEDDSYALLEYYFLSKYFDYQYNPDEGFENHFRYSFGHWGINCYTKASIEKILDEIDETILFLECEINNPVLKERIEIKESVTTILRRLDEEDFYNMQRPFDDIFYTKYFICHKEYYIDFYKRFSEHMRRLFNNNPSMNYIIVYGP